MMSGRLGVSDMADMADMAAGGASVETRSVLRPIGLSPAPWDPDEPDKTAPANRWPTSDAAAWGKAPETTVFSRNDWSPDNFSHVVLAQFVQAKGWNKSKG